MAPTILKFRHEIPPTKPARGFQGRSIGSVLTRVVAPTMRRRGFQAINILAHWPMIVGQQVAALSCPERLRRRGPEGAVLSVRVEGAMALEVQHMAPLIIERINQHYGAGMVTRLNIIQGPLPLPKVNKQSKPLTDNEIAAAIETLQDFPDGRLKRALARLGARLARGSEGF